MTTGFPQVRRGRCPLILDGDQLYDKQLEYFLIQIDHLVRDTQTNQLTKLMKAMVPSFYELDCSLVMMES